MDSDEIKIAIRAGWDAMSPSYQADSDISLDDIHYAPLAPGERHYGVIGNVEGKRVLELACGGAQNSVALTSWGASVVAMDIAPEQLRYARYIRQQTGAEFELIAGDMESPSMFRPGSFDLIISSFGWEFVPDLFRCLDACSRLLKPNGQIVVCTVHPLSAFDWDIGAQMLRLTDYFSPPVEVWEDPVPEGHSPGLTFFRTIEELVSTVTGCGLLVDRLIEPTVLPLDRADESPYAGRYWQDHWDRLSRVPFAVVISARKVQSA